MILSKRERYIAMAMVAVLGVLVLDWYVLSPVWAYRDQIQSKIDEQEQQLEQHQRLFAKRRELSRRWHQWVTQGLGSDPSAAESQVLHSVRDWAQDADMNLLSVKPERVEQDKQFQRITFRATGSGSMRAITRFLWDLHSAAVPVRVTDLQITARKEGTDDLSLLIGISTISLVPEAPGQRPAVSAAAPAAREVEP